VYAYDRWSFDREPSLTARVALAGREPALLRIIRSSRHFRRAGEGELVQVLRCPHCDDGGLRTVGYLRDRRFVQTVRACDTCGAVDVVGRD
jgi:hypothetical protein